MKFGPVKSATISAGIHVLQYNSVGIHVRVFSTCLLYIVHTVVRRLVTQPPVLRFPLFQRVVIQHSVDKYLSCLFSYFISGLYMYPSVNTVHDSV